MIDDETRKKEKLLKKISLVLVPLLGKRGKISRLNKQMFLACPLRFTAGADLEGGVSDMKSQPTLAPYSTWHHLYFVKFRIVMQTAFVTVIITSSFAMPA